MMKKRTEEKDEKNRRRLEGRKNRKKEGSGRGQHKADHVNDATVMKPGVHVLPELVR